MAFLVATAVGMDASGYSLRTSPDGRMGDVKAIEATAAAMVRVARRVLGSLPDTLFPTT
jgi:hypothetical protein